MRISDWSSDVCSSDLCQGRISPPVHRQLQRLRHLRGRHRRRLLILSDGRQKNGKGRSRGAAPFSLEDTIGRRSPPFRRSEEHTSELQSLMRISYAVFCLKKKTHNN